MFRSCEFIIYTFLVFYLNISRNSIVAATIEESNAATTKCLNISKVDVNLVINTLLTGNITSDAKFKNFVQCIYFELEYQEKNSAKINRDRVYKFQLLVHTKEEVDAMLKGCDDLTTDVNQAAFEHFKCVAENKIKLNGKKFLLIL